MEKSKINNIVILITIICCISIFSSCKKDKSLPSNEGLFNEAVQSHLLVVKNEVASIIDHPVIVDDPSSPVVMFPSIWEYENIQSVNLLLAGQATPWLNDGTFNGQAFQIISENPVDYIDTSGEHNNGVGFCESVGFEQVDNYRSRIMEYLESQN